MKFFLTVSQSYNVTHTFIINKKGFILIKLIACLFHQFISLIKNVTVNVSDEMSNFNYFKNPQSSTPHLSQTPVAGRAKMKKQKQQKQNLQGNKKYLSSTPSDGFHTDSKSKHRKDNRNQAHCDNYRDNSYLPESEHVPEKWVPPSYV